MMLEKIFQCAHKLQAKKLILTQKPDKTTK